MLRDLLRRDKQQGSLFTRQILRWLTTKILLGISAGNSRRARIFAAFNVAFHFRVFLVLLSVAWCLRAETPKLVHADCLDLRFVVVGYIPKEIKTLSDIPEQARSRMLEHLRHRLGDSFFESLRFCGGQIVDKDELYRVSSTYREYELDVFAYRLIFEFRLPEKGIEYYKAPVEFRLDGSVKQEISLPEIRESPDLAEFVSLKDALRTAAANGFDVSKCFARITYLGQYGICGYVIVQPFRPNRHQYLRIAEIDAHNGKLISKIERRAGGD